MDLILTKQPKGEVTFVKCKHCGSLIEKPLKYVRFKLNYYACFKCKRYRFNSLQNDKYHKKKLSTLGNKKSKWYN